MKDSDVQASEHMADLNRRLQRYIRESRYDEQMQLLRERWLYFRGNQRTAARFLDAPDASANQDDGL